MPLCGSSNNVQEPVKKYNNYKLIYFNAKGRAETTRMILAAGGIKFEDCRLEMKDWPELKPKTPWGTLPILEVDGMTLGQSSAIARFVAKQTGFAGKNNFEQAMCDSIVDCCSDLQGKAIEILFEKDDDRKAALEKAFMEEKMPTTLANLEKILKANDGGNGWIVGNSMTWADINLRSILEQLTRGDLAALKAFPLLGNLYKRVEEQPKIAAYLKTRPETSM